MTGIKSSPGYSQEVMDNLIIDLLCVSFFQDYMLVRDKNANKHFSILLGLLKQLNKKGLAEKNAGLLNQVFNTLVTPCH